ncbi:protein BCCIP homolog [Argonauta hians]
MATPSKKSREIEEMDVPSSDSEESLEDYTSEEYDSSDSFQPGGVRVNFEAMTATDTDHLGIRALLKQLFLKANIDLTELSDTIISQNAIGCVLKQCDVEEESDEDTDNSEDDSIYGVMSVLKLNKNVMCVQQVRSVLLSKCEEVAPDKLAAFKDILSEDKMVGFLISERFINMPSNVAVPLYESLKRDLDSENNIKRNYKFDQFVVICKTCRPKVEEGGDKGAPIAPSELTFLNFEEQFILKLATLQFTYSVAKERDTMVDGKWTEEDFESLRTVAVFDANKIPQIIEQTNEIIGGEEL